MVDKESLKIFGEKKVVIFLENKYVHSGFIKHIGLDMLILDDIVKNCYITINFKDIQEIRQDKMDRGKQW